MNTLLRCHDMWSEICGYLKSVEDCSSIHIAVNSNMYRTMVWWAMNPNNKSNIYLHKKLDTGQVGTLYRCPVFIDEMMDDDVVMLMIW